MYLLFEHKSYLDNSIYIQLLGYFQKSIKTNTKT
nr:Rpn family recombination-promoting nuclease/putative transposase [Leptospira interrogans]